VDASSIIGLVGTAVSVVGFGFTIVQIRKTATAASAAKTAVNDFMQTLGHLDIASECSRASKSLSHAVRLLRLKQWASAADAIFEAQSSLNRIMALGNGLIESISHDVTEDLLISVSELEDSDEKGLDFDKSDLIIKIRKLINKLDDELIIRSRGLANV